MIRIISGKFRHREVFQPDSKDVRPTQDRVREALFSALHDVEDKVVLDLFAGSGAYGFEALSRGAKKIYFNDALKLSYNAIAKTAETLRCKESIVLTLLDYKNALNRHKDIKFDLVFLDPPYKTNYAEEAAKIIIENKLIKENGLIILETDNKEKVIENLDTNLLKIEDIKKYGRVYLLFLSSNTKE